MQTLRSQGRRQRPGTPHLRAAQTAAQGAKHLLALRPPPGDAHARITQRLQAAGLPLPDPAPDRGRTHIQMHRQAGCRPTLGRQQTHFHPVSCARPQPRIVPQLAHAKVSDAEARRRATVDMSWKVALGVAAYARPFAQSTLPQFRAHLILHEKIRAVFQRSLELARERGLLPGRLLQVALDTTPILGRGAVKDTYNLLADGIRQLMHGLAAVQGNDMGQWGTAAGICPVPGAQP